MVVTDDYDEESDDRVKAELREWLASRPGTTIEEVDEFLAERLSEHTYEDAKSKIRRDLGRRWIRHMRDEANEDQRKFYSVPFRDPCGVERQGWLSLDHMEQPQVEHLVSENTKHIQKKAKENHYLREYMLKRGWIPEIDLGLD